jgi:RimJ/RimL family protein N-acetyltransferase
VNHERIATRRLVLEPVASERALEAAYGDLSHLAGAEDWPHAETLEGARKVLATGGWLWFVTLDGAIIGDCGTHEPVTEDGLVEIGYALGGAYRGRGLGAELVAGLSAGLLARPDVRMVVGLVEPSNTPSRRCLERAGFRHDGEVEGELRYVLEAGGERIVTPRLVLEPVPGSTAKAVIGGDLSAVAAGEGWPHADTMDGMRHTTSTGGMLWFVTLDGVVIGDCGTHAPVSPDGVVEIGYGLSAAYRGRGLGAELVGGLSRWLAARPDVRRVIAGTEPSNIPSRRCLEHAGFRLDGEADGELRFVLEAAGGGATMPA